MGCSGGIRYVDCPTLVSLMTTGPACGCSTSDLLQMERMHLVLPSRLPLSHLHSLSSHSLALSHSLSQDLEPLALSDRKCSSDRESRNSMGSRNKGKGSISLGTVSECLFCLDRPFEFFISHKAFVARLFFLLKGLGHNDNFFFLFFSR